MQVKQSEEDGGGLNFSMTWSEGFQVIRAFGKTE